MKKEKQVAAGFQSPEVEVVCLRCRRTFLSWDKRLNRICKSCSVENDQAGGPKFIGLRHIDTLQDGSELSV